VRPTLRRLAPGQEGTVREFLGPRVDSSLFLLGNLRAAGLEDTGAAYSGTWFGAFDDDVLVGVAAHFWNGILLLQAPVALPELAHAAVAASRRSLAGLSGPRTQVEEARRELGLGDAAATLDHQADLFSLHLDALRVPPALSRGEVTCGPPAPDELALLSDWRVAYAVETLGAVPGGGLRATCADEVSRLAAEGNAFVLRERAEPVAFSGFNARLPEVVQVGGVWTPPELRGRGHARCVVAGSLLEARASGVRKAVLFTERENGAAGRAYHALGFRVVGDYGVVLFEAPVPHVR
jgi:ribosomal protein S18 acetylase RimI-like enzyme